MNQQSFGQKLGPETEPGPDAATGNGAPKDAQRPAAGKPGTTNQAVLGKFTIRDLAVFAATLILLVASLLPVFFGRFNLWNAGSLFFLGLGLVLPLIVAALFAARRLAPATKIRIGSLSVDQFASVVASFALAFFFVSAAAAFVPSLLVGLAGSVILFAATVLGRFIPYFAGDFLGRDETPAHIMARESAVPLPRPHTPKQPKPADGTGKASKPAFGIPAGPWSSGRNAASEPAAPVASGPAAPAPVASAPAAPVASAPPASATGAAAPAADPTPATQAADVVPSASPATAPAASAAEETQLADVPAPAAPADHAPASAGAATHDAGAQAPAPARQSAAEPAATAVHQQVRIAEPIGATVDPASRPEEADEQPVHEAFWFAVAQHRTAVDPRTGAPAFVIEPGGWVLALEDRGHEFLVQHTDGRLGVLRDLSNIERG